MSAEAVKVIVRCRPMNAREANLSCKEVINIETKIGQCAIKNPGDSKAVPKTFTFDGAFDQGSTTEQIYADIGYPLVEGITEGYNGTIFAYGQTGCGKSFSMQGISNPSTQRGIIPRAFDHIFETIQVSEGSKYLVHASYLEIYNEEIRDLLGKDVKLKLDLKEHPDRGVYVQGLSMHACKNVTDCQRVMSRGWNNRATGATLMNAESSRSHSIFSIHLERCETDENGEDHIRAAKLNLVDLAGSERQAKTGSTGDRLKEATKINLSLSALGNVISALVDGKSKHIPYRDSKLTRLLQDSLGGNTKTLMVACLSPADNNYDETLSTLRYANRAKNIKNKPKINEDPKDALLREFQAEIDKLRAMLRGEIPADLDAAGGSAVQKPSRPETTRDQAADIEREKQRLRGEFEHQMQQMKEDFEAMKISKEKLEEEMALLNDNYTADLANVDHLSQMASPGQLDQRPMRDAVTSNDSAQHREYEDDVITEGDEFEEEVTSVMGDEMEQYDEREDEMYTRSPAQTHAVHMATVQSDSGALAPTSSPTGEPHMSQMKHDEALRRLQELQQAMVGGEEADNEEIKEKRLRKQRHAEERKNRLQEELAKMDGEDIMLDIYDNIHEELQAKSLLLTKEREKTEALRQEVLDLQSEFEYERIDYLDSVRKQEEQVKWLQAVIDKIHPCLRRDCNYINLDRIKVQSVWDPDMMQWNLPKMTVDKSKLPASEGGVNMGRRISLVGLTSEPPPENVNGMTTESPTRPANEVMSYDDLRSEDRYLKKLHQNGEQDAAGSYFKNKRTERLLNQRNVQGSRSPVSNSSNGHMNSGSERGSPNSTNLAPVPWQPETLSSDQLRAAQVHGQFSEDLAPRKPQRLEALAPIGNKTQKRKKSRNVDII